MTLCQLGGTAHTHTYIIRTGVALNIFQVCPKLRYIEMCLTHCDEVASTLYCVLLNPNACVHAGGGKGEIEISREFKEQVVGPILKVKMCVCAQG